MDCFHQSITISVNITNLALLCSQMMNATNISFGKADVNFFSCCRNLTDSQLSLSSTNLSQNGIPEGLTRAESIITAVFTILVMIASIGGNTLVFLSFIKFYTLRSVTNYFILSLGAADILVSILPMPFWVSYLFTKWPSRVHGMWYVWWMGLDVLCATASIMNLAFISIDRYICIKDPLRYSQRVTPLRAVLALIFIWCYGMLGGGLSLFDTTQSYWFEYFIFLWSYLLPVGIMIYCYIHIFSETRRHTKELRKLSQLGTLKQGQDSAHNGKNKRFVNYFICLSQSDRAALRRDGDNECENEPNETVPCISSQKHLTIEMDNLFNGHSGGWSEKKTIIDRNYNDKAVKGILNNQKSISTGWGGGGGWSSITWKDHPHPLCSGNADATHESRNSRSASKTISKFKTKHFYSELKAARTLSLVMGTFLICWTPFIISVLVSVWSPWFFSARLNFFFKSLHYSNSGINPFLYSILNKDFKKAYLKLLRQLFRRQ